MNLLSVLSKLNKDDVVNIRCWLSHLHQKRHPESSSFPWRSYDSLADIALLDKEELRKGAKLWISDFGLPPKLTHKQNVTAKTARKIFGEDS